MSVKRSAYETVEIPDERLIQAIYKGMGEAERIRKKRRLYRIVTAAAAAFVLLLYSANIPSVYAYTKEIPVLGEFVRALHMGSGGEVTLHEDISTEVLKNELLIRFVRKGRMADTVVPYDVREYHAPGRIVLSLQSLTGEECDKLEDQIRQMEGVADIYQILSTRKDTVSFVIVLERLYDYEIMEQIFPGMLSVRLFQNAYYTAEDRAPEQQVYYLRTEGMEQNESMRKVLEKYAAEDPTQVKTREGSFILTIGEYSSEEEAEKTLSRLQKTYAGADEFRVGSGMAKEVPEAEI